MSICSSPNQAKSKYCSTHRNRIRGKNKIATNGVTTLPSDSLDYRWYARIHSLLSEFVVLESSLAWLNTLGGAYAALGDRSKYHAKVAHNIATKQLAIADRLSDSKLMTRCNLYIAFGLLQQEKYRTARDIIDDQMKSSNVTGSMAEAKLYQMCLAATQRLKIGRRKCAANKQESAAI